MKSISPSLFFRILTSHPSSFFCINLVYQFVCVEIDVNIENGRYICLRRRTRRREWIKNKPFEAFFFIFFFLIVLIYKRFGPNQTVFNGFYSSLSIR